MDLLWQKLFLDGIEYNKMKHKAISPKSFSEYWDY